MSPGNRFSWRVLVKPSGVIDRDQIAQIKVTDLTIVTVESKEREERETRKVAQEGAEAAKKEKEKEKEDFIRKFAPLVAALTEAERKAVISCRDKATCDKAFSLTQIYINQTSDQKIQIATDTIIETYNPTEEGKIGLAATRTPGRGTSASIRLSATCKDGMFTLELCLIKKKSALAIFPLFIHEKLK